MFVVTLTGAVTGITAAVVKFLIECLVVNKKSCRFECGVNHCEWRQSVTRNVSRVGGGVCAATTLSARR